MPPPGGFFTPSRLESRDGKLQDKKQVLGLAGATGYEEAVVKCRGLLRGARVARDTGQRAMPTLRQAFDEVLRFKVEETERGLRPRSLAAAGMALTPMTLRYAKKDTALMRQSLNQIQTTILRLAGKLAPPPAPAKTGALTEEETTILKQLLAKLNESA